MYLFKNIITGNGLRGGPHDSIANLNLERKSLHIHQPGEGNVFRSLKLICIGDNILHSYMLEVQQYMKKNPRSTKTSFLSYVFWTNILQITAAMIKKRMVSEIIENGYLYGLLIDTTTDISKKTQISIVLKYVCASEEIGFNIKERTIELKHIEKTGGKDIFYFVSNCLSNCGLTMDKITGLSSLLNL